MCHVEERGRGFEQCFFCCCMMRYHYLILGRVRTMFVAVCKSVCAAAAEVEDLDDVIKNRACRGTARPRRFE